MANAIAAEASDLAMVDMIKIGGVTGWMSAAGQAEAASLPLSSHSYIEASAHAMACSPTASWCEYLDLAGAVLTEPLIANERKITARGPALVSNGTRRRCTSTHSGDRSLVGTLVDVVGCNTAERRAL
jgi:mandelate racemase